MNVTLDGKRGAREWQTGDSDVTTEAGREKARRCRDPNQGCKQPLEKARNGFSARASTMNQPCQHSIDSFKISDLQNFKENRCPHSPQLTMVPLNNFWFSDGTKVIWIQQKLYFASWILIFSRASDMGYDTILWFWAVAASPPSQPHDCEGEQLIHPLQPSCTQTAIMLPTFSTVFHKFRRILDTF